MFDCLDCGSDMWTVLEWDDYARLQCQECGKEWAMDTTHITQEEMDRMFWSLTAAFEVMGEVYG